MAPPLRMAPRRLSAVSGNRLAPPDITRSGKRADSFYLSPQWKEFRNQLIKERGWRCEDSKCETPHGPWKMIYGHHIIELADGGAPFDRANVLLVCGPSHGRMTTENKAKRAGWIDPLAIKPEGRGI